MPVAGQRDPDQIRDVLTEWMARQMPDATEVTITNLVVPQSSGFSNETFLLDASWVENGEKVDAELVLRSQPVMSLLFPEIDLVTQQYLSMKLLGEHSNVPVPNTRWAERDTAIIGGPFFMMDRLDGLVPGDAPPYTETGFVVDMTDEQRARCLALAAHGGGGGSRFSSAGCVVDDTRRITNLKGTNLWRTSWNCSRCSLSDEAQGAGPGLALGGSQAIHGHLGSRLHPVARQL
jgi:hypothetical protein